MGVAGRMSPNHILRCIDCGASVQPTLTTLECPACAAPLEVEYLEAPDGLSPRLPLERPEEIVSLGEGNTPLIPLPTIAAELGLNRLWAKLEFEAPTGSFKDRGSAVLISAAKEAGLTEFVEDSSGNAGASLSAYAAAAGLRAHVFAPSSAGIGKKNQIRVFGAVLHEIEGSRQASTDAARAFVSERGIPWLSHYMSPYFMEGMKAFAYELADAPEAPFDHVIFPVGNGSLIVGALEGFQELAHAKKIAAVPALHCVQADAIRPIVAAITNEDWTVAAGAASVASGISVTSPPRLSQVVDAVRDTGGQGVAVCEASIIAWQKRLAASEGIFGEATSAVAFAGLERLIADGVIASDDRVVVPVTGSGLKEPLPE